jgi:hypothetical protein
MDLTVLVSVKGEDPDVAPAPSMDGVLEAINIHRPPVDHPVAKKKKATNVCPHNRRKSVIY